MSETIKTLAGAVYNYTVEAGEHGEAVYSLERVFTEGALPVGAVVIHPDYRLEPPVAGLLNVQFGKGGVERHERTDVPLLGGPADPYVVGHQLINPADLDATEDQDGKDGAGAAPVAEPKISFSRTVRAALTETDTPSVRATRATFEKVQDLITALVTLYRTDTDTPQREAQYTAFLNGQRAELIQPEIDKIDNQIKALTHARAELTDKLNGYTSTPAQ
ncbi:hypothetical protein [Streptomyces graminilatus]|uniref:hypothetical protein n=1 Tax=Streptomyces graminilatus TaxID=1464070 RepID=UPI0006E2A0DE|nr:hypothetical protein [Streptomyces graminilatus]